ncbi:acetyl-CoA C-acyltransferase [Bacillus marasmi]|uniref:acetyl-CoA C-acyltransferase n=1 Tax=Bacillus marasmi TaxID=1926279 RepID=UPI0011CA8D82|nr:acetyl-CoA C-acyltransferase [Bacillus marasmi]
MPSAVIVNAKRTPIGKINGMFKNLTADELAAPIIRELALGVPHVNEIILGNIVGPGGNVARVAALKAGLPLSITGLTIDRQCSAGLEAIRVASCFIQAGAGTCYIAGGVESTSTSLFPNRARFAPEEIGDPDMGVAAEHVAQKYDISRKKQDDYTLQSYEKSWNAFQQGIYMNEIVPIKGKSDDEVFFKPRKMEALLKRSLPLFSDNNGTVTAANSCAINDGASSVLLMEESFAIANGYRPVLRFVDSAVAGVHPNYPGISPVPTITQLLERNQLTIQDIDLIEINEAFASKIVACSEALDIPSDKLNVRGGALTLGHPYGASGAILVTRLFYEVQRMDNPKYCIAAVGSGGGIGVALLFEVVKHDED